MSRSVGHTTLFKNDTNVPISVSGMFHGVPDNMSGQGVVGSRHGRIEKRRRECGVEIGPFLDSRGTLFSVFGPGNSLVAPKTAPGGRLWRYSGNREHFSPEKDARPEAILGCVEAVRYRSLTPAYAFDRTRRPADPAAETDKGQPSPRPLSSPPPGRQMRQTLRRSR